MEVRPGGVSRLTHNAQLLAYLHLLSLLNSQPAHMGIQSGESLSVAEYTIVAVFIVFACKTYLPVGKSQYRLTAICRKIDAVVETKFPAVRMSL